MPRLLVFAVCEKVITDTEGIVSLISVIEKVEVAVPSGLQLPDQTAVPMRWEAISMWSLDPSEAGFYEQITEMVGEGGAVLTNSKPTTLESATPGARTGAKIINQLTEIPAIEGRLEFRLSYRKIGDPRWSVAASYPVEVVLIRK